MTAAPVLLANRFTALFREARMLREDDVTLADLIDTLRERFGGQVGEETIAEAAEWAAEHVQPVENRIRLGAVAFTGRALFELLNRPEPEPIFAAIPVPGHLSLLVAPPMTGKSSLAYWLAMARAAGVAPWVGAPERAAGRVLIFSLDEAPEQAARRMRSLALFHPAGSLEVCVGNLTVIGPDREVRPDALDALRFDATGMETLARWLDEAEHAGRPFVEVFVDAYADVLPLEESENSNEAATRIAGGLERLAVRTGAAIVLLHHSGKPRASDGDDPPDVRYLGRGASALAAKARVVSSLEAVAGFPHLRRVRTVTNLARAPKPLTFRVCAEESDTEELLRFEPHDPLATYSPGEYLGAEPISTTAFAWKISGQDPEPGRRPPGEANALARRLRETWLRQGLIEVNAGPRGSKLLTLKREDRA